MKYRKKPLIIEATQWFKNGDHPEDGPAEREGKIVRYFRTPYIIGEMACNKCHDIMHNHGYIDTLEITNQVCPGDFIITGIQGEYYPCKPDIFKASYELIE